ncbi:hypothetical protein Tco_1567334 [Tanacetum coccineum]
MVDKGMQDGLSAGIEYGKAGRALSDVAAYNPFVDADYFAVSHAIEILGAGELQPSHEQLMHPIHRPEDNVALGEISLSFSLEVIHNHIQSIRGDAEARRLSIFKAMVPLIEPLSSENLLGEASTSGVPVNADVATTLSTTFAQSVSVSVPPLSIADHGVVHARLQVEDPSSGEIVFEKEKLETSPEPAVGS